MHKHSQTHMHLTFRQLQVFESVARQLSFTRAAAELFLSQPAVSMQVKQLEAAVGLPLLEQLGKRIYLTEAGKIIQHHSKAIAHQLREMEQAIGDIKGIESGYLHISVASTVNYFATRLLSEFCEQHERVRVSLDVTNRETVIQRLRDNSTDIVLMGRPPAELEVVAERFMLNPLVVIASPNHPLAKKRRIPLSALRTETFLVREPGSGTRLAMERFFEEKGFSHSTGVEMTSNEAIKQSVQAGLGLAIVSLHTLELELDVGRLAIVDVRGFPIKRHWYVAHRKGKRLSAAAMAFKDHVLRRGKEIAEKGP